MTFYRGHQLFRGQVQVEQVSGPQEDVQYLLEAINYSEDEIR
jgi:hypothetical protein